MKSPIKYNGDGTATARNWILFAVPLILIFLSWFANWTLIKTKIPDLQEAQEKTELRYEVVRKDLQETNLTVASAIAGLTATLDGIGERLRRIENNTRR